MHHDRGRRDPEQDRDDPIAGREGHRDELGLITHFSEKNDSRANGECCEKLHGGLPPFNLRTGQKRKADATLRPGITCRAEGLVRLEFEARATGPAG
ncbi:hypothetical protein GCM10027294_34210 [Marinactinospora endophytica]